MKKIFSLLALAVAILLPFNVNAASSLSWKESKSDADGNITVELYMKVEAGTQYDTFNATIKATNAYIKSIAGSDQFAIDSNASTVITSDVTQAVLVTKYTGLTYTGTGEDIKVGELTYYKDPNATEDCKITINLDGSQEVVVTTKKTTNPKTGSMLPYVGIIAGIGLIAGAYIVSRKSTKLYRM